MYRLLLVDDEINVLNALRRSLLLAAREGEADYEIEIYSDPSAALKRAEEAAFDLVLSDYRMPQMDGVAFLRAFRAIQPNCARLILSGYADLNGLLGAINQAQIFRFLAKPWHETELLAAIGQALAHRQLLLENQRLADLVRAQQGRLTQQELELQRLERENPGITQVNWGPNGEVLLNDLSA